MVPDGGHDVAKVQGGDGAAFALVFLRKRLAGVLELQLLRAHTQAHTHDGGQDWRRKEFVLMMRSITFQRRRGGRAKLWEMKVWPPGARDRCAGHM